MLLNHSPEHHSPGFPTWLLTFTEKDSFMLWTPALQLKIVVTELSLHCAKILMYILIETHIKCPIVDSGYSHFTKEHEA